MTLFIAIAFGLLLSFFFPTYNVTDIPKYETILATLLAIGLYGAVHGIDIEEFTKHKGIIIRAVTFGVVLKSLIIGSILLLIFKTPLSFLLGIVVTQIDPLSVAHLVKQKSSAFSQSAKTILRAWSSFDDPMTVILALYIFLPIALGSQITISNGILQIGLNIVFAGILFLVWKFCSKQNSVQLVLLIITCIVAVWTNMLLAIALAGLFLRPKITYLPQIIHGAFVIAAIVLGSLLSFDSQSIIYGVVLGLVAYVAQIIATPLVAPKLPRHDKFFLAFAQYNGITAILLALVLSQYFPSIITVVGIAILTINIVYYVVNVSYERYLVRTLKA